MSTFEPDSRTRHYSTGDLLHLIRICLADAPVCEGNRLRALEAVIELERRDAQSFRGMALTWDDKRTDSVAVFASNFRCIAQMCGGYKWFSEVRFNNGRDGVQIHKLLCDTREDAKADVERFVQYLAKDVCGYVAEAVVEPERREITESLKCPDGWKIDPDATRMKVFVRKGNDWVPEEEKP